MNKRQVTLKTVLWALLGVLAMVTLIRFFRGLGATTALTDASPWGLWIAFDVMAGVALAAGGFTLAATVYIFGHGKYKSFARPAILTALLGYTAVAVGLLYDLGLPWNIWHPMIYPQPHSVLFEVAMCVILYLTVLMLEFGPVILEHRWFDRPFFQKIHRLLKKVAIPLVITGIVLSTLHQSSLGSLFLITPYRLHPLWYSPLIWILYLVTAIGLGLMMVTAESFFSAWYFGHKLKTRQLSGLGRAASVVLLLYAAIRLGDLAVRGQLGTAFDGSWQGVLFLFEISFSALVPGILLLLGRIRNSAAGLAVCSGMVVLGMIGYRFDVCLVAFSGVEGMSYFPSRTEFSVSLGIVAGAMLVFIFFVEKLKVYPEEEETAPEEAQPEVEPAAMQSCLPVSMDAPRRYSLAAVLAAALAVAFIPQDALLGDQLEQTPVAAPRTIGVSEQAKAEGFGHDFALSGSTNMLMIDGNRDGRLVLFNHDKHRVVHGDQESCKQCHHMNMPLDKNSSCSECHREMYTTVDVFSHSSHIAALGENEGCTKCHKNPDEIKTRQTAAACSECHSKMTVAGSTIEPPREGIQGFAVGYMDAMHNLCIKCHEKNAKDNQEKYGANFAQCATCHRDIDAAHLQRIAPYVSEGK